METLRFLIKGQMIKKDPACSFNRMVAGSSNYYIAAFEMDDAWTGYSCLAKFNVDGKLIYEPIVSGKVVIPEDVLKYKKKSTSGLSAKRATLFSIQMKQKLYRLEGFNRWLI